MPVPLEKLIEKKAFFMKCEHINKIQRDSITSCLSHKKKLIDIDNELDLDTALVSKEIKEIELTRMAQPRMMPVKEY